MPERESTREYVRTLIAQEPSHGGADDQMQWLRRLCSAAAHALPASGAGISLMGTERSLGVAVASSPASQQLEELQFTLGEGPCVDAHSSYRPVFASDLEPSSGARWPLYTPAAYELGVRAVFAFPLQMGASRLGVLDVYREVAGSLSRTATAQAITFAEVAMHALLDGQDAAVVGSVEDALGHALDYRSELYQAQGMVMVQLGGSVDEAIVRLRAYTYAHNRTLGEVAHDIVVRRLTLDRDAP